MPGTGDLIALQALAEPCPAVVMLRNKYSIARGFTAETEWRVLEPLTLRVERGRRSGGS